MPLVTARAELIKNKKRDFYQEKLRGNVGKPKELWKDGEKISFDEKTNNNSFNNFYINLIDGAVVLALPISKLCNLLMKHSKFPLDCKIVKLKPLYEKGSKTDPKNYHPISLLPLVSKVIEKVIHNQTKTFLSKNKILYKYQSGF